MFLARTQAQVVVVVGTVGLMAEPTMLNVELALLPSVVIAAMQTTMIRASMTAYSTAVGPSSFFRNETRLFEIACMRLSVGVVRTNRVGTTV